METISNRCPRDFLSRRARWIVVAVGMVLALAAVGVWHLGEIPARTTARAARRAVADSQFDEADATLGRWLLMRPRSAEAYYLKARVALARKKPQEAVAGLAAARALGYPAAPLDRLDAIIRANAGRHAEAEPVLRRVLEESKAPDPEAAEALARVYLETYRFQDAAVVIDRWMRDAPDDAKPYLWRTEVNSRLKKDSIAQIRDYRAALDRDPTLDRARLGLAGELRLAGRHAEAASVYDSYIDRNPDEPAGHLGAGLVALDRGDDASAILHLDRTLELAPVNSAALSARAAIAVRRREDTAALDLLDRAVRITPHDVEIRHRRGLCLARLGRRDEARAEQVVAARLREDAQRLGKLQLALVTNPGDLGLQGEIAHWMIEHGHEEEGIRWARKILDERPNDLEANRMMVEYHERGGSPGLANYYRLQAKETPPPK
ncbi:tetratricopeptide repeat protein [Isosphaeraceae bacterium EP7]